MTEVIEVVHVQKLDPKTGFTCVNCRLVFADADLQREHYRSEWHRYNVKRQVAELPPISMEQFQDKVQSYHQQVSYEIEGKISKASSKVVYTKKTLIQNPLVLL